MNGSKVLYEENVDALEHEVIITENCFPNINIEVEKTFKLEDITYKLRYISQLWSTKCSAL